MKKRLKYVIIVLLTPFILLLILFLIRLVSPIQLDDVSPEIPCSQDLLKKADIFYVIPKFNNISIAENQSWCKYILSLNKTIEIHGVYHTFNEFYTPRSAKYLKEGIDAFKECFGFLPERFKPPQIAISKQNSELVKTFFKLDSYKNQLTHKVYHCNDSDKTFPNKWADIF